ncbi:hypothetical protein [Nocardia sp. NPDC058480]|uniref:hypothetical protein n=1 Tax=unclassified Nocardia TaxID=2637762 RepID=UPI003649FCA8
MSNPIKDFGETAKGLAHNPLGVIALFIVLVYGMAALVTAFAESLSPAERMPLIYFLVSFPILVLAVFTWLVSRHSGKLFSPRDFKDDAAYIAALTATASLAAASSSRTKELTPINIEQLTKTARTAAAVTGQAIEGASWRRHILWVDDRPDNNILERNAFEAMGLSFTLCLSTVTALWELRRQKFAVIISDMGRREGAQEGYVLLDQIRNAGDQTPYFIYSSESSPEHRMETMAHKGQGNTAIASELFEMVMNAILKREDFMTVHEVDYTQLAAVN